MRMTRFISAVCCLAMMGIAANGANTIQNFEAEFPDVGAIPAPDILTTVEGAGPAPIVVDGWDGQALRLTHDLENGQNNSVAFNRTIAGGWSSMNVNLDIRVDGEGAHADGYGFGLLNTGNYGQTTATATPGWQPEEPNLTNSFGVGFDTFHNDGLDPLPGVGADLPNSVSLHYNGAIVDQLLTSDMNDQFGEPLFEDWLQSGNAISMNINLAPVDGGMNATITMVDSETDQVVVPFENVLIPGMTAYESRIAFRGRTGGSDSNQEIDNISYQLDGGPQVLIDNFESYAVDEEIPNEIPEIPAPIPLGTGTPYTIGVYGSDPGPELAVDGNLSGVQDGHLQLTRTVGGQHNFVAFDKTTDETDVPIVANFKFRVNDSGNNADGFAVALVDSSEYGDTGELTEGAAPWNPAEAPDLVKGFGLGFDTFDNDEEGFIDDEGCGDGALCTDRRANHISLHWDGLEESDLFEEEGFIDREEFDLVNDAWNDVTLTITPDGGDSLVSLTIVDGTDGSVHEVYSDFRIQGMSFEGGPRFAAGGRTGGAFSFQSIDDINISFGGDPCDFDGDGVLGAGDIDALSAEIQSGNNSASFDITGDGLVDFADLAFFVGDESKLHTFIGDSNLDGEFNSSDFVQVFTAGEYEDGVANNSTWATGDWNGDGDFDSGDFVTAFTDGGFELGPKWNPAAAQQVPEPSGIVLILLATCGLIARRR